MEIFAVPALHRWFVSPESRIYLAGTLPQESSFLCVVRFAAFRLVSGDVFLSKASACRRLAFYCKHPASTVSYGKRASDCALVGSILAGRLIHG
jgi:hypothetical protein